MTDPTDNQIIDAAKAICDASSKPCRAVFNINNVARQCGIRCADYKTRQHIASVLKNNGYRIHSKSSTGTHYTPDTSKTISK